MKQIIIKAETEKEAKLRFGAYQKAIEFEKKYMAKVNPGKQNALTWKVTETESGKELAVVHVYYTKTSIVAVINEVQ